VIIRRTHGAGGTGLPASRAVRRSREWEQPEVANTLRAAVDCSVSVAGAAVGGCATPAGVAIVMAGEAVAGVWAPVESLWADTAVIRVFCSSGVAGIAAVEGWSEAGQAGRVACLTVIRAGCWEESRRTRTRST
jgi:hypothetical protein